ncbi:MAG: DUF503 domain-containing protein [Chloroflexi bacterium]|nr:DUF503 domain-containing protein [Chloroflexota bacterium]
MNVGVCRIRLRIPENHSLKGKRHVLKSIIARVQNKFNVAIAEVEDQDLWQVATLGMSCVSNHGPHADEILAKVVDFIEGMREDVELLDYETEIIHAF